VQERAVEFLELFRLAGEAIGAQPVVSDAGDEQYDPPLLLTQAVPSLFTGQELNPVAPRAQKKVPLPPNLDLDQPINPSLYELLVAANYNVALSSEEDKEDEEFQNYYYVRPSTAPSKQAAALGIDSAATKSIAAASGGSYQGMSEEDYLDADILARRRRERSERNRDDPFYIFAPGEADGVSDADLESIPVLELKLDDVHPATATSHSGPKRARFPVQIATDESLEGVESDIDDGDADVGPRSGKRRSKKKGLLEVDTSGLMGYSLDEDKDKESRNVEEKAAKEEVARLRREMELAAERVAVQRKSAEAVGGISKKTRKAKPTTEDAPGEKKKNNNKKKKKVRDGATGAASGAVKKKRVKKAKKESEEQDAGS
jgi:AP-3 complex subunit delta-1